MENDLQSLVNEIKTVILTVLGYDRDLDFIGKPPETSPKEFKKNSSPKEFLKFASEDIKEPTTERGKANSLSNCKRAIDCQFDSLIKQLGYFPLCRRKKWHFPKKIDFIRKSGIIAPRILEKINKLRNKLEHEFKVPSKADVEDALDVALLFVSYAEIAPLPSLSWGTSSEGGINVRYNNDDMSFNFFRIKKNKTGEYKITNLNVKVRYGQKEFDDLYQFFTETVPNLMSEK